MLHTHREPNNDFSYWYVNLHYSFVFNRGASDPYWGTQGNLAVKCLLVVTLIISFITYLERVVAGEAWCAVP